MNTVWTNTESTARICQWDLGGPPGAGGPTTLQGNRLLGLTIWIKLGDHEVSIPLDLTVTWSALQICVAQFDLEKAARQIAGDVNRRCERTIWSP